MSVNTYTLWQILRSSGKSNLLCVRCHDTGSGIKPWIRKLGNPEKISVERLSKKYANIRMTSISYFLYADCLKIENIGLVIVHAQYIMELDHWEPKGWYFIELKYRYNDLEIRSNIRCWLYQFQLIFFTLHVKHINEKR